VREAGCKGVEGKSWKGSEEMRATLVRKEDKGGDQTEEKRWNGAGVCQTDVKLFLCACNGSGSRIVFIHYGYGYGQKCAVGTGLRLPLNFSARRLSASWAELRRRDLFYFIDIFRPQA